MHRLGTETRGTEGSSEPQPEAVCPPVPGAPAAARGPGVCQPPVCPHWAPARAGERQVGAGTAASPRRLTSGPSLLREPGDTVGPAKYHVSLSHFNFYIFLKF